MVKQLKIEHEYGSFADALFFLKLVEKGTIKIKSERLYFYRLHKEQVSKKTNKNDELKFLETLKNSAKKNQAQVRRKISERVTNLVLNDFLNREYFTMQLAKNHEINLSPIYAFRKIKLLTRAVINLAFDFLKLKDYFYISKSYQKNRKNTSRISVIIFSYNRPFQLHGLLESLFLNLENQKAIYVIWKSTDLFFEDGYTKIKQAFPLVCFIKEKNFQADVEHLVKESDDNIMFATDDSLLFEKSRVPYIEKQSKIICFSLRLGENINFSHPLNRFIKKPRFLKLDGTYLWKWRGCDGEFGYPMSLDGHIFEKTFMLQALQGLRYTNPNELEDSLYKKIKSGPPNWIMSFSQSRYVSVPVNRVQFTFPNRAGSKLTETPSVLNKSYLLGKIMDIQKTVKDHPNGTHQEFLIKIKKDYSKSH